MSKRKWLTGHFLEGDNLFLLSRAINGNKEVLLFGKASYIMKRRLSRSGWKYDHRLRRWSRKMGKSRRLPIWLKEE